MTLPTLHISTIANAIAALNVPGLTIRDIDEVPASGARLAPVLIPRPDYVSAFSAQRDSFGGGAALQSARYTLGYRLLYAPLGSDRNVSLSLLDEMIALAGQILDAVMSIDVLAGAVDITPAENAITNMGIVNDPAEVEYWGCDLAFRITDFVN